MGAALGRVLGILLAALVCASVCGMAALYGAHVYALLTAAELGLATRGDVWLAPFVALESAAFREAWLFFVLLWGGLGGLIGIGKLWRVRLVKAVPPIVAASAAVAFLLGALSPILAMFGTLIAGCAAIAWCRMVPEWELGEAGSLPDPSP